MLQNRNLHSQQRIIPHQTKDIGPGVSLPSKLGLLPSLIVHNVSYESPSSGSAARLARVFPIEILSGIVLQ